MVHPLVAGCSSREPKLFRLVRYQQHWLPRVPASHSAEDRGEGPTRSTRYIIEWAEAGLLDQGACQVESVGLRRLPCRWALHNARSDPSVHR